MRQLAGAVTLIKATNWAGKCPRSKTGRDYFLPGKWPQEYQLSMQDAAQHLRFCTMPLFYIDAYITAHVPRLKTAGDSFKPGQADHVSALSKMAGRLWIIA